MTTQAPQIKEGYLQPQVILKLHHHHSGGLQWRLSRKTVFSLEGGIKMEDVQITLFFFLTPHTKDALLKPLAEERSVVYPHL